MDETAKAARREYYRRWRAEHREQVAESQNRYWLKKAAEIRNQAPAATDPARGADPQPVGIGD